MKIKSGNKHTIDILFTLSLFCVFAASAFIVVYIGADVYRTTVNNMHIGFDSGTALNFVSTKIRQHDESGNIRIDSLDGHSALVLEQSIGEAVFETWIYHYNGALKELFINRENRAGLRPGAGDELIRICGFEVSMPHERLISITVISGDDIYIRKLVGIRSVT